MTEQTDKELKKLGLRRATPVGKRMGTKMYCHRKYEDLVVPAGILEHVKKAGNMGLLAGLVDDITRVMRDYVGVKWDVKTHELTFQTCEDFDTADEPTTGIGVRVKEGNDEYKGGPSLVFATVRGGMLWHHKWMWVADDYAGFDVEASKKRSLLWVPHMKKGEFATIGNPQVWAEMRKRWESG